MMMKSLSEELLIEPQWRFVALQLELIVSVLLRVELVALEWLCSGLRVAVKLKDYFSQGTEHPTTLELP